MEWVIIGVFLVFLIAFMVWLGNEPQPDEDDEDYNWEDEFCSIGDDEDHH